MSSTPHRSVVLESVPPRASAPLTHIARRARRSLERFLAVEAAGGIVLLVSSVIALVWANSPWRASYEHLWHTPLGLRIGGWMFERPLEWVINDGLMVGFFFVVGLEIRREIHSGELSEWKRAALPIAAALGGMIAPAALYLTLVSGAPAAHAGWGVPMATDIAFAVGVLALLGRRVPPALRVLLLALAVVDDLGAILVIVAFYSSGIVISGLLVALLALAGIVLLQRFGVRSKLAYVVPGLIAWAGIYAAGIHPTIAGVLIGLMTPVQAWLGPDGLRAQLEHEVEALRNASETSPSTLHASVHHLEAARREALAPADALIESLHPWTAFVVMPLFGLANAGVPISADILGPGTTRVALAIAAALLIGKPVGVLASSALAVRLRLGVLPTGLHWRHVAVVAVAAGIGFTMSIFIAALAFPAEASLLGGAKLGVLAASGLAACLAFVLGRVLLAPHSGEGAKSAEEAESSTVL